MFVSWHYFELNDFIQSKMCVFLYLYNFSALNRDKVIESPIMKHYTSTIGNKFTCLCRQHKVSYYYIYFEIKHQIHLTVLSKSVLFRVSCWPGKCDAQLWQNWPCVHCSLQNCLRHTRGSRDVAIPSEFPFLQHRYEIIRYVNCILGPATNLLIRHLVFEGKG